MQYQEKQTQKEHEDGRHRVKERYHSDGHTTQSDNQNDTEKAAGIAQQAAPAPDPAAAVRSEYNSNYASLFGHLHDQPYTGSIWG